MFVQIGFSFESKSAGIAWIRAFVRMRPYVLLEHTWLGASHVAVRTHVLPLVLVVDGMTIRSGSVDVRGRGELPGDGCHASHHASHGVFEAARGSRGNAFHKVLLPQGRGFLGHYGGFPGGNILLERGGLGPLAGTRPLITGDWPFIGGCKLLEFFMEVSHPRGHHSDSL